jgi:hypothetical protein
LLNSDGKEKVLLNLKVDGLQKHANKQTALVGHSRVPLHEYYMNNDSQHQSNKMVYVDNYLGFVVEMFYGRKVKKI